MFFFRRDPSKYAFVDRENLRSDVTSMALGYVNLRSSGERRGPKCISIFAFWQDEHNETIRLGLIRFRNKFWAQKMRALHHTT